eukprot:355096-Chlamydomonas_euryale.AAC.11
MRARTRARIVDAQPAFLHLVARAPSQRTCLQHDLLEVGLQLPIAVFDHALVRRRRRVRPRHHEAVPCELPGGRLSPGKGEVDAAFVVGGCGGWDPEQRAPVAQRREVAGQGQEGAGGSHTCLGGPPTHTCLEGRHAYVSAWRAKACQGMLPLQTYTHSHLRPSSAPPQTEQPIQRRQPFLLCTSQSRRFKSKFGRRGQPVTAATHLPWAFEGVAASNSAASASSVSCCDKRQLCGRASSGAGIEEAMAITTHSNQRVLAAAPRGP